MTKILYDENGYYGDRLKFKDVGNNIYTIVNNDEELLGHLERLRVGRWMSWCLTLETDCYLSAGCQDEVREVTRKLNAKEKVKSL